MEQAIAKTGRRTGWSESENKLLWETADEAQQQGLPLKAVFEQIARQTGRRPNSIRNYYYAQVRSREDGQAPAARFVPYPAEMLNDLHVSDIEKRYDNAVLARLSACDLRDIRALPDVSEGLEFAVKNALAGANTVRDIVDFASSKRIPKSRLRRATAHLIMAATEEEMTALRRVPPYLRVLAMNGKGRVVVRYSGTEPKLRLMVEAEDADLAEAGVQRLVAVDLTNG